ncbi:hypothetical protein PMI42_06825 [Bradyrhizobium sp. YR681]|uniref:hypothetical protein n=1 Tax=Bradyrhizobium sp. YR681 TaxID=1144344 RepID=UPI00026F863B|nr:hypothetical protein [Bradyrhizobium sp. YR681]EJN09504.1 hypothetical protein PMI42_06825 [Bradyrhizobium sp. YR681]
MFEIGIFCVILLAAGYWATMFVMGRRDDVIHGKFIHTEDVGGSTPAAMPPTPPFPRRPVKIVQPANVQTASVQSETTEAKPVSSAALQSLLAAIQQDLKSVA